ncbi:MAG: carboxypeptidase regulatory-like domain-containing protein [bacterium]
MNARRLPSAVLWLSGLVLLAVWVPGAYAASVTISGTVIDETAQQPVAGAKVELTNSNYGTGYFVTTTNADGKFSFTDVRSNIPYDLAVVKEGYCTYEMNRWRFPDNQNAIDLNIALIRGATLKGQVVFSDGSTPVSNAQVKLSFQGGNFSMIQYEESLFTDEKGEFVFASMPPNIYSLDISLGGYIGEQIVGIRPQPGEEKSYTIKLYRPAGITGVVRLEGSDSPLRDIEVAARGASQQVGTSDEDGFFSIAGLLPGTYQLQSNPAGFRPYESADAIQLKEGESRTGVVIGLQALPPSISINLQRDVFLPDQDVAFQMRTFRVGQYECDIREIPLPVFLQEKADTRAMLQKQDLSPFKSVLHWVEEVPLTNPYVWVDKDIKAPQRLPHGAYVLRAYSTLEKVEHRALFFVTELGIIVKRGENSTFVYATHLKTNMPVRGAKVKIQPRAFDVNLTPGWSQVLQNTDETKIEWSGETDEQGILVLKHNLAFSTGDVLALSPDGHFAISPIYKSGLISSENRTIYPYTDRPVYRPGQTVYYKAVFRDKNQRDYTIPAGATAQIEVSNPEGEVIHTAELTLNEWGSVNGSLDMPKDTPLGSYNLTAAIGDNPKKSIHFFVEEYRKPEFLVKVEPAKPFYINGEILSFAIRAEYYFGGAVPNAEVRYRFYETLAAGSGAREFPSSYSRFLFSGETKTDAEGMARIEYVPPRASRDRRVTVEVEVQEASGRKVTTSEAAPVGVGMYYILARPSRDVFDRDTPLSVELETLTHDGQPVTAALEVDFVQEVWNPVQRTYVRPAAPQASFKVNTDANGLGRVEWLPDTKISGRIEVEVHGTDEQGNEITAAARVWRMVEGAGSFDFEYPALEGILDKKAYQPGEEAVLLLNTQYPENPVVLTIESRDILSHRVIWPSGKTTRVTIPILPEYAPNVFIGLFMPRGINLSTREYVLNIPEKRGDLKVELTSDRTTYKPRETGHVTIKTTLPDGTPVPAEVSLAVVDEAIFAIRRDHTPDIHQVFYDKQANWVSTSFSYPINYYGGANKGIQADVRKDFRDTAVWIADIYTDEKGEATADVYYPDNLTTWRLTSRAHTKNTEVGWTKSSTQVTKELVARLALPRFFLEQDELQISTQVNNLTTENLPEIQTQLAVSGGVALQEADTKTTQAAAGAVARELWGLTVNAASPTATFVFQAKGKEDEDALELSAPVLPLGYREDQARGGKITGASTEIPCDLGEDVLPGSSKFEFTFTPSLAGVALGAMPYLTTFPYGCIEQTINGYLPNILLLHALRDMNALPAEMEQRMESIGEQVEKTLQRIYAMQGPEGGWGWFQGSEEEPMLTAFVVDSLLQADRLGYPVESGRIDIAMNYLKNTVTSVREWDTQAYLTYVLGQNGQADDFALNTLYTNRNEMFDFGLAVSALALHGKQKDKEANEMLDLLLSHLQNLSERHAAWQVDPGQVWQWSGTAVETTAWGLMALLELRGVDATTDKISQWLVDRRRGNRWRSTRETALVIKALTRIIRTEKPAQEFADLPYTLRLNGQTVQEGALTKNDYTKPVVTPLNPQAGTNTITLEMARPVGFWALNSTLFHHGELLQPTPNEYFKMTRLYETALHTKDYRGRPKLLPQGFPPDDSLKVGQEILVTLVIEAKRDLPYMIVEDPLPSGCEVIESFFTSNVEGSWEPYSHYERRDQKMVFFLDEVGEGETRIEYLIRTELPGRFRANPAYGWCMYYPEINALSATNRITVK